MMNTPFFKYDAIINLQKYYYTKFRHIVTTCINLYFDEVKTFETFYYQSFLNKKISRGFEQVVTIC